MEKQPIELDSHSIGHCPLYKFPHFLCRISEEEKTSPTSLFSYYQRLLECNHYTSYNFLITRDYMMLVPRSCVFSWLVGLFLGVMGTFRHKQFRVRWKLFCEERRNATQTKGNWSVESAPECSC